MKIRKQTRFITECSLFLLPPRRLCFHRR